MPLPHHRPEDEHYDFDFYSSECIPYLQEVGRLRQAESSLRQAHSILAVLGKKHSQDEYIHRRYKTKELLLEDRTRTMTLQQTREMLSAKRHWDNIVSYEVRIFETQRDTGLLSALQYHLGIGEKRLVYHGVLGSKNGLHTFIPGAWQEALKQKSMAVPLQPLPPCFHTII